MSRRFHAGHLVLLLGSLCSVPACNRMTDQARGKPYRASDFFDDGALARTPVPGTVARGALLERGLLTTGKQDGRWVTEFPVEIDRERLDTGRKLFDIHCTPCHGYRGDGNGMIVQRGYPRPPTFHEPRLRRAPLGHLFDVVTSGFGKMPAYGPHVDPADRWAIVAYLRVLQLSQDLPLSALPEGERRRLQEGR